MEQNDLFFKTIARDFNIDKLDVHSGVTGVWKAKIEQYGNWSTYHERIQMTLDIIGFKEGIEILDVGCGVGAQVIELAHLGANCAGIDVDKDAIRVVNQVRDDFGLNLKGIHGNACDMPFEDETFDVVMSQEFFEHVPDFETGMREQIRVLKTGGKLVIEQSNFLDPFVLYGLLVKYPLRTKGQYGGIKWLFTKGRVRENIYGTGWPGKDEDIHSRLWWWRKMKQYSDLRVDEVTGWMAKRRGGYFRLLQPFIGNILIVATKQPK